MYVAVRQWRVAVGGGGAGRGHEVSSGGAGRETIRTDAADHPERKIFHETQTLNYKLFRFDPIAFEAPRHREQAWVCETTIKEAASAQ
jgi:hypothetical protein